MQKLFDFCCDLANTPRRDVTKEPGYSIFDCESKENRYFESFCNYQSASNMSEEEIVQIAKSQYDSRDINKTFRIKMPVYLRKPKDSTNELPILCLGLGRYLSWFRGYRFQISGTPTGIGDCCSSRTTLQKDIAIARDLPPEYGKMLLFSHIAEIAMQSYFKFDIPKLAPDLFDEFMYETSTRICELKNMPKTDWCDFSMITSGEVNQSKFIGLFYFNDNVVACRNLETGAQLQAEIPAYDENCDVSEILFYKLMITALLHTMMYLLHVDGDMDAFHELYEFISNAVSSMNPPVLSKSEEFN